MRKRLGIAWRWSKEIGYWGLRELPKSPGLEIYSKAIDQGNIELTIRLRDGGETAFREYIAPYVGQDIPKIIWMFWAQGEEKAPLLVRRCIASWREKNPDWDIRVLTSDTVAEFADISDVPGELPFRFHADLLRLRLLARYGGVWTDATTFCHRPLAEWIPLLAGQTGFFAFRGPHFDRWIDSWFIAAHRDNPLIQAWAFRFGKYVTKLRKTPAKYFMIMYALQWAVLRNTTLRQAFRSSGGIPAVPAFFLQGYLEGRIDAEPFKQAYKAGFPVSKLNWRLEMPDEMLTAKLDVLGL